MGTNGPVRKAAGTDAADRERNRRPSGEFGTSGVEPDPHKAKRYITPPAPSESGSGDDDWEGDAREKRLNHLATLIKMKGTTTPDADRPVVVSEWAEHGIPREDIGMWRVRGYTPRTAAAEIRRTPDSAAQMRAQGQQVELYESVGVPESRIAYWVGSNVQPELASKWNDDPRPIRVAIAAARQGMTPAEHDEWFTSIYGHSFTTTGKSLAPAHAGASSAEDSDVQEHLARGGYDDWPAQGFTPTEAGAWWNGKQRVNSHDASDLRELGITAEDHERALDAHPYRVGFTPAPPPRGERNARLAKHIKQTISNL